MRRTTMDVCKQPITIVVAEDDDDDSLLLDKAFQENCSCIKLKFVHDGLELFDYLQAEPILPGLIITDMNMPNLNGIEILKRIKQDSRLLNIPVIVFTTSDEQDAIVKSYCTGANSFIRKPTTFDSLVNIADIISRYWCEIVLLPGHQCEG
jgi:CheY-like chemotaxis protein